MKYACAFAALLFLNPSLVCGGLVIQPDSAASSVGHFGTSPPSEARDQSGLSVGYINGVADFDTYLAMNPTHDSTSDNFWFQSGVTSGNFDLDLGGSFNIESMALWNDQHDAAVNSFTLLADDNSSFSSPTNLGNLTANQAADISAVPAQRFDFASTSASHVRIQINSTHGFNGISIGEVAFNSSAVPEPSSFLFLGLIASVGIAYRWKNVFGFFKRQLSRV